MMSAPGAGSTGLARAIHFLRTQREELSLPSMLRRSWHNVSLCSSHTCQSVLLCRGTGPRHVRGRRGWLAGVAD